MAGEGVGLCVIIHHDGNFLILSRKRKLEKTSVIISNWRSVMRKEQEVLNNLIKDLKDGNSNTGQLRRKSSTGQHIMKPKSMK